MRAYFYFQYERLEAAGPLTQVINSVLQEHQASSLAARWQVEHRLSPFQRSQVCLPIPLFCSPMPDSQPFAKLKVKSQLRPLLLRFAALA